MCLSSITKVHKKPVEKTFYKVFKVDGKYIHNVVQQRGVFRVVGEDYRDDNPFKIESWGYNGRTGRYRSISYQSGFHGFATKIGAEAFKKYPWLMDRSKWVVFKCRGLVRTEGYQDLARENQYKTVVADTMTIIERVKQ